MLQCRRMVNNDRGLTLIETLVTLAIMASIAGVLVSFQWISFQEWRSGDNQSEVQQSVRIGVQRIAQKARKSSAITVKDEAPYGRVIYLYYQDVEKNQYTGVEETVDKVTRYYVQSGVLYEETSKVSPLKWGKDQAALYIQSIQDSFYEPTAKLLTVVIRGQAADGQRFDLKTEVRPRLVK